MKNIENLSKGKTIPRKIDFLTWENNQLLRANLEDIDTLNLIKKNFKTLLRFGQHNISKIKNEKDFEDFILGFEKIFHELEIDKIYNSTSRSKSSYKKFDKLDLFKQFFYISTPTENTQNFSFIKGGVCYHWSLFFFNLFKVMDKQNKLSKEFILYQPTYDHGAFIIGFKNKKYIIDPYAKENGLLTEVKKGNKVYLSAIRNRLLYGEIEDEKKLKLKIWKGKLTPKIYKNKANFLKNIPDSNELLNIKTYIGGKTIHIIIKSHNEHIFINYKGQQLYREKEFAILDIISLYMENKVNKLNILLALTGFNKNVLRKNNLLNEIEIIASKINIDFLFEKLGIEEDIKMFK